MKEIAAAILFCYCLCPGCSPVLRPFNWLEGTWELEKQNGSSRLEIWEIENRKMLSGKGISVVKGDSTLLETIGLYKDDRQTWYTPVVSGQNKGAPIPFKLVSAKGNQYVFENPEHDFPQRITYHFKPLDRHPSPDRSPGDSLLVDVTSLTGEGIQFQFYRK